MKTKSTRIELPTGPLIVTSFYRNEAHVKTEITGYMPPAFEQSLLALLESLN